MKEYLACLKRCGAWAHLSSCHRKLFAQQIPLAELYFAIVRSWITSDTSDFSLGYSSSKNCETTMVTLALAVGVCGARAAILNLTQRIFKKIIRSFEENVMSVHLHEITESVGTEEADAECQQFIDKEKQ
ncbi:hypothetical protein HID58_014594 [Brassica napus]|uniref:Uncharacterized protein n=1 Tax=Brassica napus TaxID=3708 RepID=A0ABQ8DII9_BRANA|nr:hypothetical protein HID58_014594 [Brassica napus]